MKMTRTAFETEARKKPVKPQPRKQQKVNKYLKKQKKNGYLSHQLKFWQNKKGKNLFEMPTKNDVFFSAASCENDMIFGGHLKQISALPI